MKRFLKETKYLLFFFVLLTSVTIFSIADTEVDVVVVKSPADLIKTNLPTLVTNENTRSPASVVEPKSEILPVNVYCEGHDIVKENSARQLVMLNLNLCRELKSVKGASLINTTNGFKAQIFKLTGKNYRTDYIQLNKGTNILVLEAILKDGQKRVQTLEILSGT